MSLISRPLMRHLFGVVVLAAALRLQPAAAGELPQSAHDAFDQGDYATALAIVGPLAEQGDARAQGALGYLHYFGLGVPEDHAEAYLWIRMGAEGGDLRSQVRLGILHDLGHGTRRNPWEAVSLYRAAAERGNRQEQDSVCVQLFNGEVTSDDHPQPHSSGSLDGTGDLSQMLSPLGRSLDGMSQT